MKKIILIGFLLCIAIVAACGICVVYAIQSVEKPGPLPQNSIVLIERGKGVNAIAAKLEQESVISYALLFKAIVAIEKDPRALKAGEYEFPANVSMREALTMMRDGKVYERKVTLPEGMTSWQIAETLKSLTDISGEITDIPEEGTLLPQTYHYIGGDDRQALLGQMAAAMTKTVEELWPARATDLPFTTQEEALTLASIVEKETGVAAERAKIAGVFINRLKSGMPLQSDPTVIYAMTEGEIQNDGQGPIGRRLLSKDLEMASPYNTYMNTGLPPGPIANPGREAIEAVLHPETHNYLYFVADGSGGHVFAATLAQHNQNVAQWRKFRRTQD